MRPRALVYRAGDTLSISLLDVDENGRHRVMLPRDPYPEYSWSDWTDPGMLLDGSTLHIPGEFIMPVVDEVRRFGVATGFTPDPDVAAKLYREELMLERERVDRIITRLLPGGSS